MKSRLVLLWLIVALAFLLFPVAALAWYPYGAGPQGYGGAPWSAPGFGPETVPAARLDISRSADRDNYYVNIRLNGIPATDVKVAVEGGRWLTIRRQDSSETHEENVTPDPENWSRSYSYSYHSGGGARRFSLPRDADSGALQRKEEEGRITITIPRRH